MYYNTKNALLSPYKLYLKLNKKVPLKRIKDFVKKQDVWQVKQPKIKTHFNHIHAIMYGRLIW